MEHPDSCGPGCIYCRDDFEALGIEEPISNEDRETFYKIGHRREDEFIAMFNEVWGENMIANPQRSHGGPDAIWKGFAEIKTRMEPFYLCHILYPGVCDPRFTQPINVSDIRYYERAFPNLHVFFWLKWDDVTKYDVSVEAVNEAYYVHFSRLRDIVAHSPIHTYQQRVYDTDGNKKDAYLIDMRELKLIIPRRGKA